MKFRRTHSDYIIGDYDDKGMNRAVKEPEEDGLVLVGPGMTGMGV